jgi:DNA-binding SARP family transcriptional activator
MEFRILGPLEVRGDRGAVALGGPKPRALLAVLLLHANEALDVDRLALALWGEDAPAGAGKTVQVHVSRLRKALGDPDRVQTTAAGYRLRVNPAELDTDRFAALADDGRRALAAGRAPEAAALLREALALWRGPPLQDLTFAPFAQVEIARLEEQRLAALEARLEADLASGRHAELLGELQQLVAEQPTRERPAAQLMLALYRCGRQADALAVYRETRRRFVAELGVEPGRELRALEQAILEQDEALGARPTGAAVLPARTTPLFGRDTDLEALAGLLG